MLPLTTPACRRWRSLALGLALLLPAVAPWRADAAPPAREVRVGVYANAPKIFLDANGQASGILGDLLGEIARREGWTLRAVPCDWQDCLSALQAGSIDLLPDLAHSEQRAQLFDMHRRPALHSWSQLYRRQDAHIEAITDLQGKRVAVLAASVQEDFLRRLLADFGLHAELVRVRSLQEGFAKVAAGEVDAAAANRFFGDSQAAQYGMGGTPIMFQPARLFYATAKGRHPELLAAIDRHLDAWQEGPDSAYARILAHWAGAPPRFAVPPAVWWGLAGLSALLLLALAGAAWLRREVTEKTRHLRASEDRLATILNSVDAYIFIKDRALNYQYVNRKVSELFGRPPDDVVGRGDGDFFDAETAARLRDDDLRVLEGGERVETEEIARQLDGRVTRAYLTIKLPLRDADGRIHALCGIATDITRHKEAEAAIHQLAFYDPLTQLPNRRLLLERLEQSLAASARHAAGGALLFIDIDNFKDLNDTLGHDMGDRLLSQVAERLSACTRGEDTLARLGGDEFVVMLQGLDSALDAALRQAAQAAQKIQAILGQPYTLSGTPYQTSVSIGIAMFSDPHSTMEELLKRADLAMYRAKAEGRNAVRFFNPEMQAQVSARAAIEADLHAALGGNRPHGSDGTPGDAPADAHFLLHYQPQVDARGRMAGVEALVRWQHPVHGLVPPGRFIPVAESSGLILPLGNWILRTACRQLAEWAADPESAGLFVAVNVSARQFRHPDFVGEVLAALADTGADPARLKLELTESQLIDNLDDVIARMDALKARGVRFSLDDFGTGYSSLSVLKRLPLDQLKIDQSFVRDLLSDPEDEAIVETIVALGRSLGLEVIAEGVETVAQRDALARLGCRNFQGYLFGRPAPAAALRGLIAG